MFAVFGFAIRTNSATALTTLLLLFRLRSIIIVIIWVITEILIVRVDETVEFRAESQIELKRVDRVQIIQIVSDVVGLFQCLHKLVIIRVDIIILAVMNTLWFLFAFKHVEERFTGDSLDYDTLLSRLFVLLCLFSLFLGHILTFVPLDFSSDNLNRLVRVVVSNRDKLEWFRVRKELVLRETHLDCEFGSGDLFLGGV